MWWEAETQASKSSDKSAQTAQNPVSPSVVSSETWATSPESSPRSRSSRGWWNYVFSPTFGRSNTTATRVSERDDLRRQTRETTTIAIHTDASPDEKAWSDAFSSLSPLSPRSRTGHTTAWMDFSGWTDDRNSGRYPFSNVNEQIRLDGKTPTSCASPDSTRVKVNDGKGAFTSGHVYDQPPTQPTPSRQLPRLQTYDSKPFSDIISPSDRNVPLLIDESPARWPFEVLPKNPFRKPTIGMGSQKSPSPPPDRKGSIIKYSTTPWQSNERTDKFAGSAVTKARQSVHGVRTINKERSHSIVTSSPQPPPYSRPHTENDFSNGPLAVNVHQMTDAHPPYSPGPVSPYARQGMAVEGGLALAEFPAAPSMAHTMQRTGAASSIPHQLPERPRLVPVTLRDLETAPSLQRKSEKRRARGEREDAFVRRVGGLWRGRGCFGSRGCWGKSGIEARKRRRWIFGSSMVGVIVIVIVLALALALTKKVQPSQSSQGSSQAEQTNPIRWLNLTDWPSLPIGIMTVAQPDVVEENSGCVFPSTMWSCSLPKEVQRSTSTDIRLQPDFKFDISFKNDSRDGAAPDTSDPLWLPAPPPPSAEDQRFLGDSTDGVISSLKEGEPTPFYISFLSPNPEPNPTLTARDLLQRQSSSGVPDVLATIPLPETEADGSAKAANLIPLPTLQPLRLYDRGLPTEHYGFYTYFDRSIFLRSTLLLTETDRDQGPVPADLDGGSTKQEALRRCTWAQTRFLVQIWTNRGTRLLDRTTPSSTNDDDGNTDRNSAAPRSSDLARPGSFPYPVTLTTDRHGGDVSKKMIYCYALDERANIMPDRKAIQIENRGFGGRLVGGGQGPLGKDRVGVDEGGLGGIDGGTGGCSCRWSNAVGGA